MYRYYRTASVFSLLIITKLIFTVFFTDVAPAQDFGERRSREGGRGGFGGNPGGGGPPWMRGGQDGGRMVPQMGQPMGPPGGGNPFGGGPPPWMNGGGEGGRSEGDRNEQRTLGMLRSMDTNGNGILDPNEVPEYRKRFVDMTVSRLGGDPNKPVNLNDLARRAAMSNNSGAASGNSSGGSRSSNSTSSSNSKITADPLVPAFGEKEETKTLVLEFGQREATTKKAAVGSSAAALSQSDQILRQAREIMNKYDRNKNGTLDKDKGEWVSSLPFNADRADKNRDGRVSMAELISALGGQSGASAGAAAVVTKSSTPYDRLPPGMPDWFIERDKNQDAQLTMLEYANGQPMSEAIAEEFRFLDRNNDGTATVAEVFETLKQIDEEKRRKEEQAQRERERRQGINTAVSSAAATPAGTVPVGMPPQQPPVLPEGGQPPAAVPPSPTVPAVMQSTPNWQPGSSPPPAPTSVPSAAPYSGGSSSSGNSSNERTSRYGSGSRGSDSRNSRYGRAR